MRVYVNPSVNLIWSIDRSVGRSVGRLVGRSVGRSSGRSVGRSVGRVRSRFRCLDWQQHDASEPRQQCGWHLLLPATPATHHPTFTDDGSCTLACPGPHPHPSRLLQRTPRCRSEVPARKVTVCPPCRRQASSAASASRICFRHHASTVALARDARSHQVQTVHARVQMPPRTRTSVPVGPLRACHGAHSPQIICDTRKISVSPPDENQDDRSARILFRIVCCLECTSSAPARPWSLAKQFQD